MRIIILFSFVFVFLSCQAPGYNSQKTNEYVVSGYLPTSANARVELLEVSFYKDKSAAFQTTADDKGKFYFRGQLDEKALYKLTFNGQQLFSEFVLENSKISLSEAKDASHTINITGSTEEDIRQLGNGLLAGPLFVQQKKYADSAYEKALELNDNDKIRLSKVQINELQARQAGKIKKFIKAYPTSFTSVNLVSLLLGSPQNWPIADSVLLTYEKSGLQKNQVAYFRKKLNLLKDLSPGKTAPGFCQQNVKGDWITLNSQKGNYVLLDFWASWCAPCRRSNPKLKALYRKYKSKGLKMISVSLDDDRQRWLSAVRQDSLVWENISDLKGWNNNIVSRYAVMNIPSYCVIGPNGRIIDIDLNQGEITSKLKEIFHR